MNKKIIFSFLTVLFISQLFADTPTKKEIAEIIENQIKTERRFLLPKDSLSPITPFAITEPDAKKPLTDFFIKSYNANELQETHPEKAAELTLDATRSLNDALYFCHGNQPLLDTTLELAETSHYTENYKKIFPAITGPLRGKTMQEVMSLLGYLAYGYYRWKQTDQTPLDEVTVAHAIRGQDESGYRLSIRDISTTRFPERVDPDRNDPHTINDNKANWRDIVFAVTPAISKHLDHEKLLSEASPHQLLAFGAKVYEVVNVVGYIDRLRQGTTQRLNDCIIAMNAAQYFMSIVKSVWETRNFSQKHEKSYPLSKRNLQTLELHNTKLTLKKLRKEQADRENRYKHSNFDPEAPTDNFFNPRTGEMESLKA